MNYSFMLLVLLQCDSDGHGHIDVQVILRVSAAKRASSHLL